MAVQGSGRARTISHSARLIRDRLQQVTEELLGIPSQFISISEAHDFPPSVSELRN